MSDETHFDCATIGYLRSFDTLNKLGSDRVNNERIVVNFLCKPSLDS